MFPGISRDKSMGQWKKLGDLQFNISFSLQNEVINNIFISRIMNQPCYLTWTAVFKPNVSEPNTLSSSLL